MDYGRDVEFGYFPAPDADDYPAIVEQAQVADQTGLDFIGIQDIWVGAAGPRMLNLIGRLADGWIPSSGFAPPERLPELHERIDEAAQAAGRKPSEIRRVYNVSGTITDGDRGNFLEGSRLVLGRSAHWSRG